MRKPILSICIPTYNRAEMLKLMLQSLVPQVAELGEDVELVISDNCSPDHTQEVIEWAKQFGQFRYFRNTENIGACRNGMCLVNEYATGAFCWCLGDDDMVVKGKLKKIVGIIKANPDLNYFYINSFFKTIEERDHLIQEQDSNYIPTLSECMCRDFSDHRIARWEELLNIDNVNPPVMFTGSVSNIFRRSVWLAHSSLLRIGDNNPYACFDTTFPHITILAHAMVGKPLFYIGDPCVMQGQGSQDWIGYWGIITLMRLNEALDLYERLGVKKKQLKPIRKSLVHQSGQFVAKILFNPETPGREYFSFRQFLWRNRHFPGELMRILDRLLRVWLSLRLPKPIYQSLRAAKRQAIMLLARR